jgi:hypothetical protein
LIALSRSIRNALTEQFGTAWRAKTTEELSTAPQLESVIGCDQLRELTRFLDQVDHLKFAPERPNHRSVTLEQELATWEPRIKGLTLTIRKSPKGDSKLTVHAPAPQVSGGGRSVPRRG